MYGLAAETKYLGKRRERKRKQRRKRKQKRVSSIFRERPRGRTEARQCVQRQFELESSTPRKDHTSDEKNKNPKCSLFLRTKGNIILSFLSSTESKFCSHLCPLVSECSRSEQIPNSVKPFVRDPGRYSAQISAVRHRSAPSTDIRH